MGIRLVRSELAWDGLHNRSYWFVEQPAQGVYLVAVDQNRRVVLVDHYRAPFDAYFWEVPAGGIRPSEGLFDGARRELMEEVGVTVESFRELGVFAPSPGLSDTRAAVLLGIKATVTARPRVTPEIRATEFVTLDAAIDRLRKLPISSGGSLLALLMARDVAELAK